MNSKIKETNVQTTISTITSLSDSSIIQNTLTYQQDITPRFNSNQFVSHSISQKEVPILFQRVVTTLEKKEINSQIISSPKFISSSLSQDSSLTSIKSFPENSLQGSFEVYTTTNLPFQNTSKQHNIHSYSVPFKQSSCLEENIINSEKEKRLNTEESITLIKPSQSKELPFIQNIEASFIHSYSSNWHSKFKSNQNIPNLYKEFAPPPRPKRK